MIVCCFATFPVCNLKMAEGHQNLFVMTIRVLVRSVMLLLFRSYFITDVCLITYL